MAQRRLLRQYLVRVSDIPDAGRDLMYLSSAGEAVDLEDPELASLIEEQAVDDPSGVISAAAERPKEVQQRAIMLLCASDPPGFRARADEPRYCAPRYRRRHRLRPGAGRRRSDERASDPREARRTWGRPHGGCAAESPSAHRQRPASRSSPGCSPMPAFSAAPSASQQSRHSPTALRSLSDKPSGSASVPTCRPTADVLDAPIRSLPLDSCRGDDRRLRRTPLDFRPAQAPRFPRKLPISWSLSLPRRTTRSRRTGVGRRDPLANWCRSR